MKVARFDFVSSLQPLLKRDQRGGPVSLEFKGPQSVKHLIESLGIPHTEIGSVRLNGGAIGMGTIVQDGDRLEVRGVPPENLSSEPRFVLDGHLGRLASHLRMLGLDCLYESDFEDERLAALSVESERILLTRDRLLLMRKIISKGYLLRSLITIEQLNEVVERYQLADWVKPFQRCMRCNHPLEEVVKETILERLEPLTKKYYHEFKRCTSCQQIYWKGSHYERMLKLIETLSKSNQEA